GDFNLDGVVNVTDLLSLLGAWGICPGCVEDTNLDGSINVTDLLTLLANWG
ncbi:MAG: serine protease, partial [Planctomycetes bacterium]|nr:serine protease [Planctomycetota bacterium]